MLVAKWEPTPSCRDAYSVGTPNRAFRVKGRQMHCKTTFSPLTWTFLLGKQKNFFWKWLLCGCSILGGPGILGLALGFSPPGQLSVEFVNIGGWLTCGDMALDSCAQFLAVAEHRLIPSRSLSVCHQLRRAGHQSVWSPASQDQVAGVGVVSLARAPLTLSSFVTPQFSGVFQLGPSSENHSSYWSWRSGSSFCCLWLSRAEEDAEKLQLTDRLLQAVLAEAQVVCIGQPMLIAGDLNADPATIPCLAEGISTGRYVDLALAYSLGAGLTPDATCRFSREEGTGSRRDFFVGCPNAAAAFDACVVTDRWFYTSLFSTCSLSH